MLSDDEANQGGASVLSTAQLQAMIADTIQASLPSLEDAIATKVADSLTSRGEWRP